MPHDANRNRIERGLGSSASLSGLSWIILACAGKLWYSPGPSGMSTTRASGWPSCSRSLLWDLRQLWHQRIQRCQNLSELAQLPLLFKFLGSPLSIPAEALADLERLRSEVFTNSVEDQIHLALFVPQPEVLPSGVITQLSEPDLQRFAIHVDQLGTGSLLPLSSSLQIPLECGLSRCLLLRPLLVFCLPRLDLSLEEDASQ